MRKSLLQVGEPAPWFQAPSSVNSMFHFDTVAGRYVLLSFLGSFQESQHQAILSGFQNQQQLFDGRNVCYMAVTVDDADRQYLLFQNPVPNMILFLDLDADISKQFGAVVDPTQLNRPVELCHLAVPHLTNQNLAYRPVTYLLDERLRILAVFPISASQPALVHVQQVLQNLSEQPRLADPSPGGVPAPVLVVPRIFEPPLCQQLIQYYETHGGKDSGFMRDIDGKTVPIYDYQHKRRRDQQIEEEALRQACMHRIHDRLVPELLKAFQFRATRIERYIVACYEGETAGHFRAHRDNTTKGTAHRRFAVSLNLNTGAYAGGELWFPEFGRQRYAPPAGGAVVFSCSLLHEATPVTAGRRYAFLPFLYDDAAAAIRQQNLAFLANS